MLVLVQFIVSVLLYLDENKDTELGSPPRGMSVVMQRARHAVRVSSCGMLLPNTCRPTKPQGENEKNVSYTRQKAVRQGKGLPVFAVSVVLLNLDRQKPPFPPQRLSHLNTCTCVFNNGSIVEKLGSRSWTRANCKYSSMQKKKMHVHW